MGFLLHNVSDVAAVRPYLRRKYRGEAGGELPEYVCYAGYNNNGNPLGGCRYLFR